MANTPSTPPPLPDEAGPAPFAADNAAPLIADEQPNPFLTRGNLMLAALFAAGIAGLYALSLRGGPSAALADQQLVHAKVEAALSSMSATPRQPGGEAQAIVDQFYTAARQRQVPADQLATDPFVFEPVRPKPEQVEPDAPEPKPAQPAGLTQALEAAGTLRLQSILFGSRPAAMVSNNLVTVGQTIAGWTVMEITRTQVRLRWKDREHVLRIAQ